MLLRHAWKTILISFIVNSMASAQFLGIFPGSQDSDVVMSDTYKSYQKALLGHLDELKQKYLSDEYTRDIPDAVTDAETKTEKLLVDKVKQYQEALGDATKNAETLETKVKEYEGEEKSLVALMTGGNKHSFTITSVQEMARTCQKYDLQKDKGQDPEGIIKQNYNDAIATLNKASNRLWNASSEMWGADQALKKARQALATTQQNVKDVIKGGAKVSDERDEKQEHVFQAQRGAYDAAKDLTHLRDAAVSVYESYVSKDKAQRDELDKKNASLQGRCLEVQKKLQRVADILNGKAPDPAPAKPAPDAAPPAPVKKIVKKRAAKPKAPTSNSGDGVPYIYPDEPTVPDDSENFLLTPPQNDFLLPPPSSEGDH